LIKYFLLVVA